MIQLDVPYYIQGRRSANCGPCAVKSLFDYHTGQEKYSLHSINKRLKTTQKFGCEEEQIIIFFENENLKTKMIRFHDIERNLLNSSPVLALFKDELHDGHYAVIIGFDKDHFIFHDPWPDFGACFKRQKNIFKAQANVFNNWLLCLSN